MADIFKIYGSAIGPTLAFCLGILAFFIKYAVDRYLEKVKVTSELAKLTDLIRLSTPPKKFHPHTSSHKPNSVHLTADEARNMWNIATFHNRLIAIEPLISFLDGTIYGSGTRDDIRIFNSLKFRFSIMLKNIEAIREKGYLETRDFEYTNHNYDNLIEVVKNPESLFGYVEET